MKFKAKSNKNQNQEKTKKQFGGSTYVEKPKKFKPLSQKEIDKEMQDPRWVSNTYLNNNYPEVTPDYNKDRGAAFRFANSTLYTGDEGPVGGIISEIPHAIQRRKSGMVPLAGRVIKDGVNQLIQGKSTYEIPGSIEYEAHTELQDGIDKDVNEFITSMQDPYLRSDTLKEKLGSMRKFKRQYGGSGMEVIVEDGELYKDLDGVIQEVTGYDHHDNILQDGKDISITNKNNGGELVEVQTVLSDSYSKVLSGDRKNTAKEKKLKFTAKDAKKLIDQKWFSPRKDMSPSEVVREAEKQKLKHLNKYDDVVQNDKISQNSKALNIIQNPTKEEIYDLVFEEQESRMNRGGGNPAAYPTDEEMQYAEEHGYLPESAANKGIDMQYGGAVPTSLDGLYEYPNQPVMVPAGDITMEGIDYPVDAYDGNTGEYLDTMQPDMNYKFNTNKVLEVPKAQFGTRDRSAHYRRLLEQAQSDLAKYDAQLKNASSPSERKLAQLYREKAQNSVNYLSNNPNLKGQVEIDPNGEVWNPLAQQESNFPLLNSGVESTVNMPTYTGPDRGVRRGIPASATPPINGTRTPASISTPLTGSTDPIDIEKYIPEPYRIKRGDSLSKIANAYGLTVEDLLKMNPDIADKNKITEGDMLQIPELKIKGKRPDLGEGTTDRMAEIEGITELPAPTAEKSTDGEIPTLDIKAEDVAAVGQKAKDVLDKVKLGKIDRTQGTLAIKEMMRANRSINLPYKAVAPNRTIGYQEEDVTPYLDEIDSSVAQQLQYVNQNTSQGQAILSNIMGNASRAKRQTINRANAQNLQRRQYTDNANVQLQNQQDLMQEQFNKSYVDETYQTIAAYDRNRVQQADYVDQMTNNNTRLNNTFLLENIKNPNFQIDPVTGEVYRIGKQWDAPKAKYGLKKRKS